MNRSKINILIPIIFFLFFIEGNSQIVNRPFVINYDKKTYQADNQNWSIAEDPNGIIYIGNNKGLLEFDGANWDLYKMPDQMVVRSVATDSDSIIYVGSFEEFGYWKKDRTGLLHYTSLSASLDPDLFHNDEIWRIIPHNSRIYFQSFSSIFIYDGKSIQNINPGFTLVLLCKARDRLFIHGVDRGLFELKGDSLILIPETRSLGNDEIKVILPYQDNKFLIGAAGNGMFIYDGISITPWESHINDLITRYEVNNGLATENVIAIGTIVNGIFIMDNEDNLIAHLNAPDYLQNNTILSLCTDESGNIWAGLDRGIDYIKLDSKLDFYMDPKGLTGTVYTAALEGQTLLIGTNQGLYSYQQKEGYGFTDPQIIEGSQGQVWNLIWKDGELLCGHTNGTYRLNNEKLEMISDINGGSCIKEIKSGNKEFLIQSTYSVFTVYRKGITGWEFLHNITGFSEPVSCFEIDYMDNIWAAHSSRGLFRLKLNREIDSVYTLSYYDKEKGLATDRNLSVANIENRIIFTTGQSFYTYDDLNDTIIPYNLLNDQTGEFRQSRSITPVGNNMYWLVGNNKAGLFRIEDKSIEQVFYWDFSSFGAYLASSGTVVVPLDESRYLFCLDNGFAIMNEKMIQQDEYPANVYLRHIQIKTRKGKPIFLPLEPGHSPIEISYSYRNLTFIFSAAQPTLFPQYVYKLEGLDDNWSDWNSSSTVEFSRLPAGNYVFNVKTKKVTGNESDICSYAFKIRPPWYFSIIAIIFYALLLAGIVIIFRFIFLKRLKKHKERLERDKEEKIRNEKLIAEQELIRLKNEKLQAEIAHTNMQLSTYTMNIIKKNELLIELKKTIQDHKKKTSITSSTEISDKLIKLIERNISSDDDWTNFEIHFDLAHQDFLRRLKSEYPDLTPSDLKLCAYLRMNLSSKEIVPLLNISLRGVEVRRYRLRKRLNMKTEDNLIEFLMSY